MQAILIPGRSNNLILLDQVKDHCVAHNSVRCRNNPILENWSFLESLKVMRSFVYLSARVSFVFHHHNHNQWLMVNLTITITTIIIMNAITTTIILGQLCPRSHHRLPHLPCDALHQEVHQGWHHGRGWCHICGLFLSSLKVIPPQNVSFKTYSAMTVHLCIDQNY